MKGGAPKGGRAGSAIDTYIVCNEGTVAHYGHFLFGGLIPLMELDAASGGRLRYRVTTHVGPMQRVLKQVFPDIVIARTPSQVERGPSDKQTYFDVYTELRWAELAADAGKPVAQGRILLPAYDVFNSENFAYVLESEKARLRADAGESHVARSEARSPGFDLAEFGRLERKYVQFYAEGRRGGLAAQDKLRYKQLYMTDKCMRLRAAKPRVLAFLDRALARQAGPRAPAAAVLLVERRMDPAARIDAAASANAGGQRRGIYNHAALRAALEAEYGARVRCVRLEDMGFFEQYRAFRGARVVVGQHGAGLGNTFFMDPGAALVEICPEMTLGNCWFENLSAATGVAYAAVPQPRMTVAEWRAYSAGMPPAQAAEGARAATGAQPPAAVAARLANVDRLRAINAARLGVPTLQSFVMNSGSVDVRAVLAAVAKSLSH